MCIRNSPLSQRCVGGNNHWEVLYFSREEEREQNILIVGNNSTNHERYCTKKRACESWFA